MTSTVIHSPAAHSLTSVATTLRSHHSGSMMRRHTHGASCLTTLHNRVAVRGTNLRLCSCYTSSMRCPVELEAFVRASRYLLAVERMKDIPRSLIVWKFYKSVSNRLSGFVPDELHTCHGGNLIELLGYVMLVHPWLDVSYPKCPALSLSSGSSWLILVLRRHPWCRGCRSVHLHAVHLFW